MFIHHFDLPARFSCSSRLEFRHELEPGLEPVPGNAAVTPYVTQNGGVVRYAEAIFWITRGACCGDQGEA